MSERQILGSWGEKFAREYLEEQGLDFVMQNFLCKMGEIDLIMRDGKVLVFVEVRVRHTQKHGDPLESINYRKQLKVRRTAEFYLQKYAQDDEARIDVIGIDTSLTPPHITWIDNAF